MVWDVVVDMDLKSAKGKYVTIEVLQHLPRNAWVCLIH